MNTENVLDLNGLIVSSEDIDFDLHMLDSKYRKDYFWSSGAVRLNRTKRRCLPVRAARITRQIVLDFCFLGQQNRAGWNRLILSYRGLDSA